MVQRPAADPIRINMISRLALVAERTAPKLLDDPEGFYGVFRGGRFPVTDRDLLDVVRSVVVVLSDKRLKAGAGELPREAGEDGLQSRGLGRKSV